MLRNYASFGTSLCVAFVAAGVWLHPSIVLGAEDYFTPIPVTDFSIGPGIPDVFQVPGKEFSNRDDITTTTTPHSADAGQIQLFRGDGQVRDATDFSPVVTFTGNPQIDALAHNLDAFYTDARTNAAAIVVSFQGDGRIHYESINGSTGVWATVPQITHSHVDDPTFDLDALEIYGPEDPANPAVGSDANQFSVEGDGFGFSVMNANGSLYVGRSTISGAIANLLGIVDESVRAFMDEHIDVDALMSFDISGTEGTFDAGDSIMISLMPISMAATVGPSLDLDGGEIFLIDAELVGVIASFLDHGGHLWNTAFDVRGAFGVDSENVDALEAVSSAVPTPSAAMGGLVLLTGLLARRRRRA